MWWERRQLTHGEIVQPPTRSGLSIVSLTKNYKMAGKKDAKLRQGWKKPAEGYLMLNIDASYDEDRVAVVEEPLSEMVQGGGGV